ncbi:hypothetical protein [Roseivirga pacifica]|nr:hypothetical protein [Roseivirga pacifica]
MGVASTILLTAAKPLLSRGAAVVWENRNHINLLRKTKFGKYKNMSIRFSMSGLFKIQIPGTNKYLLVFNRRIENQLQPVGGAYKRYGDDSLFNNWGYKPDSSRNGLDVDEKSSSDLRFSVEGRYASEVLNWFESRREREENPKREFNEELLETGILDSKTFSHFDFKHIRRFSKTLSWSDYFSCYEILTYDIFEMIPDEAQKLSLIELANQELDITKGYAVVSCDDIEQLRLMAGGKQIARIGQHAKLLINQSF